MVRFLRLLGAACVAAGAGDGVGSALWGDKGEAWRPEGRLSDFSWAGYRMGEGDLPVVEPCASVRDFGAKGDGVADDTRAFKEALDRSPRGAILVPAGRYRIEDVLVLRRSGQVLRGDGPERSVLVFPRPLNEVAPNWGATTAGRRTSNYSWGGGFILIRGSEGGETLSGVVERALRGSRNLKVSDASRLRPGDVVEIRQKEAEGSLVSHLYGGRPGDTSMISGVRASFVSPVEAVAGGVLTLVRQLRTDVDPRWGAEVRTYRPEVTECGVEDLGFEFPCVPYEGHFTELGWNPLAFQGVAHCWGRNLRVLNGDSGPYLGGKFCTLRGVVLESARGVDTAGLSGHHGITAYGDDNLIEDFAIRRRYVHDLTVERSAGNVFRKGRADDLSMDHHKKAPHANLFTDLDLGKGTRPWRSGGGAALGLHSGAWGTFWNLRARSPMAPPTAAFGPELLNFVGVYSSAPGETVSDGRWWEDVSPDRLVPADLYAAQLERRRRQKAGK